MDDAGLTVDVALLERNSSEGRRPVAAANTTIGPSTTLSARRRRKSAATTVRHADGSYRLSRVYAPPSRGAGAHPLV
jgi:hypothetical protein